MRQRLRSMFTHNIVLKIIALLIGFLIWLFVTNSNDPTKTLLISNVPIVLTNESSIADIGKVVQPEGSGTVTLRITERKSVLARLSKTGSDFTVTADLENINELSSVPLTVTCTNSAVTWDEIEMSPSSLKVTLEDKVEQAYSVSVTTSGSVANGCAIGSTDIEAGKTLLIAGPASLLNIIDKVTAPINVTGLSDDAVLSAVLKVFDKNGSELTESQLSLLEFKTSEGVALTDRTVSVDVEMWSVMTDIRFEVTTSGRPAAGYKVGEITTIPETISLAGTEEALSQLGGVLHIADEISVAGATSQIEAEIDLTETLNELDGLKLLSDTEPVVMVTVAIEKSGDFTVDIPLSEIIVENAPDDMKLVFTPADKISVSVHGSSEQEIFTAEELTASVDLSVCSEEGTYDIPVEITLPEGFALSEEVTLRVSSSVPAVEQQTDNGESESESETSSDTRDE